MQSWWYIYIYIYYNLLFRCAASPTEEEELPVADRRAVARFAVVGPEPLSCLEIANARRYTMV